MLVANPLFLHYNYNADVFQTAVIPEAKLL